MLSFPNAFLKFPWIKEFSNAKHLFKPAVHLPAHKNTCFFSVCLVFWFFGFCFFLHPIQAYSSTQTFPFLCRGLYRQTRPRGRFFPLTYPTQSMLSTQTFFHWNSHTGLLVHPDICEDICWRLLTLPAHSRLIPVQKDIWSLLDLPSHIRLIPVHKDIWRLLTFRAHSGFTPVHKDIWRLLIVPAIRTLLYQVSKAAIFQQNLWSLDSFTT